MSRKIDRFYTVIQTLFFAIVVLFFFVAGWSLFYEISWGNDSIPHNSNNEKQSIDNRFDNDEFINVFHENSKGCDDPFTKTIDTIPANELNELYMFLTQHHNKIDFDEQNQTGRRLVTCAILAAENLGVPAHMLPEFINYTLTAASHSHSYLEPDAFIVYAAEHFLVDHPVPGEEYNDESLLYNSLDVIFEFTIYFLLVVFLFLLIRIERNTRR